MKNDRGALGLYVHIPFCLKKCRYCDFCSFAGLPPETRERYIDALVTEIGAAPAYDGTAVSVFFGGGTPSLLTPREAETVLSALRRKYCLADDAEITFEANPKSMDADGLSAFRALGFNRISIGVQSFCDEELQTLGRIHTAREAEKFVEAAFGAGFGNVGIDLIYAVPGQTPDTLKYTLSRAVSLAPTHISAYGLILEEGTDFYRNRDKLAFFSDDAEADCYATVYRTLEEAGYRQYEISNYARDGFMSVHNLGYWQSRPYLGFGVSAYSCFGGVRRGNTRDIARYMASPTKSVCDTEEMTPENTEYDYIMLALRTADGIAEEEFFSLFGHAFYENKRKLLQKYVDAGYAVYDGERTRLTHEGFYLSDAILTDIL